MKGVIYSKNKNKLIDVSNHMFWRVAFGKQHLVVVTNSSLVNSRVLERASESLTDISRGDKELGLPAQEQAHPGIGTEVPESLKWAHINALYYSGVTVAAGVPEKFLLHIDEPKIFIPCI